MNDLILDAVRHNDWASKQLLEFCKGLDAAKLAATAPGVYGDITSTFRHIIDAEYGYGRRLSDGKLDWERHAADATDLAEMSSMVDGLAAFWEEFLGASAFDPERIIVREGGQRSFEVRAGIVLAQIVHHGTDHRSQICTVLTAAGEAPPQLDLWSYGQATGRFRHIPAAGG